MCRRNILAQMYEDLEMGNNGRSNPHKIFYIWIILYKVNSNNKTILCHLNLEEYGTCSN